MRKATEMAIADILTQSVGELSKGPTCTVCTSLAVITPTEADALRQLLADARWRYTELSERLRNDPDTPLDITAATLARHAKGRCSAREKLRK